MSEWWKDRMASLDFETTGVEVETARIVTASLTFVGGGEGIDAHLWLVNPGIDIPEGASNIHGITTEQAKADGMHPAPMLAELLELLRGHGYGPLVGFNHGRYDLTILDRECRRHGLEPYAPGRQVVDGLVIDKWVDKYRRGSRKLTAVCGHYGIKLGDDAHEAGADALAAARLAYRLGSLPTLRDYTLEQLHDSQVMWAAEQARGLAEYFRRQGKQETVREEWPVIPWAPETEALFT